MGSGSSAAKKKFSDCYTIFSDLGEGAFSVVKLAVDKNTGNKVAVKVIQKKALPKADLLCLQSEIDILRELDHPHIIKLYEVFEEKGVCFIVTELVQGGELFDRIVERSGYTEKNARDLIKIFLETVAYMHDAQVVHRDLKPENLLLSSAVEDTSIKVADFGFAKRVQDLSRTEIACGTIDYVAPEVIEEKSYGVEVDIWSMGVICYVLLAGYPPFYSESESELLALIKSGSYTFHDNGWSDVSDDAKDFISRMLVIDQEQRWTARELMEHPWMTAHDDVLECRDLTGVVQEMIRQSARRKFRAATNAVIMTNRLNRMLGKPLLSETIDRTPLSS
ncbi:CaMKI [Symbiodinium microadriaticum]|nr:CaMKI [Symbiodinium microadriaticum]